VRIGVKSSRSLLPLGGMVEQVEIVRVYAVRIVEGSGQVRFDHVFWSGNKRSPRSVATAPTVRNIRDSTSTQPRLPLPQYPQSRQQDSLRSFWTISWRAMAATCGEVR
jgi:hypothetical protein